MQDLRSHYVKEFARFYKSSFPSMPCKSLPKKLEDLNFTETTVLMDWEGGVLYQNLFKSFDNLPSDVEERMNEGKRYNVGDEVALRAAGFTADAAALEGRILAARNQIEEQKLAEITARNNAADEARRNAPRTPKQINFNDPSAVRARRDWKLSDDIGLGA